MKCLRKAAFFNRYRGIFSQPQGNLANTDPTTIVYTRRNLFRQSVDDCFWLEECMKVLYRGKRTYKKTLRVLSVNRFGMTECAPFIIRRREIKERWIPECIISLCPDTFLPCRDYAPVS